MIKSTVVPKFIDTDSNPQVITGGGVHNIFNARITNFDPEKGETIDSVKGNTSITISNISGVVNQTKCIGQFNDLKNDRVFYFIWDYLSNHKIMVYKPATSTIETVLQGSILNFDRSTPIISCDFYDKYLIFTDNANPPRYIDVDKANRTGKKVKATLYFGVPDTGTIIFENGQEYLISAVNSAGAPLFTNELILTANGTYEDDVLAGANAYVAAFNANTTVNSYFVASVCACGEVEITELAVSGTNVYAITTLSVSVSGIPSPAPTLLVYDNIYPNNLLEYHLSIPKYTPKYNPVAVFGDDSTYTNNFVFDKVFQFAYRYVYKDNVKSCFSPISPIAVPDLNCHSNGGNYIDIDFSDSAFWQADFLNELDGVDLFVRQHNEGEWEKITSLKLCSIGISRQFYKFYNNEFLLAVSQAEAIKPNESVPFVCKTLALASEADAEGTRLFTENGIEGYDNTCNDFVINSDTYTPDGCPYTYDVEGEIELQAPYYGSLDPMVWWDGTNIVFGGLGGISNTANIANDYGQVLPAKGFTVYLTGTNYFAITKQRWNIGAGYQLLINEGLTYYDLEYGILDGSDASKMHAIRHAIGTSTAKQVFTIKNVKHGQYTLRVASHWCTLDGSYKGYPYKIDDTLNYQRTSTYVTNDITDISNYSGGRPTPTNARKELYVEVPYNTISTGLISLPNPLILLDLTDADVIQATAVADGYSFARDITASNDVTDMANNFPTSYLQVTPVVVNPLMNYGSTDHNGFWFAALPYLYITTAADREVEIKLNGVPYLNGGDFLYTATLDEFSDNVLLEDKPLPGALASRAGHYITVFTDNAFPQIYRNFVVSDGAGDLLRGVLVSMNCMSQYAFTNSQGEATLLINDRQIWGDVSMDSDFAYFSLGNGCCLNLEEWDNAGVLTPNVLPYDVTGVANPIPFYALSLGNLPFNTWKVGGSWNFRIAYYDSQNRLVGMTSVKQNASLDNLLSLNDVNLFSYEIPIGSLPPTGATHYQLVRTLNPFSYLQVVIGDSLYYLNYSSDSVNSLTSYQAGNAREIHIDLTSITLFNNSSSFSSVNYEFKQGDTVTILLYDSGGVLINPDYVNIPITKQIGNYIVINNDYDLPNLVNGMLIQINMPIPTNKENELYYEFGESHRVYQSGGVYYHGKGHDSPYPNYVFVATDQDAVTPATGLLLYGDTWRYSRTMQTYESDPSGKKGESGERQTIFWTYRVESPSLNDYFDSEDTSIGRAMIFDSLAERKRFTRLCRYSNVYKPETQNNGLFNFETLSYRNLPIHIGDVTKMVWTGDVLLVLGTIYPISLYVGRNTITDTNDNNLIASTDSVIPQYRTFQEQLGRTSGCRHPLSVVSTGDRVFWYDSDNGTVMQYASNTPLAISDKNNKSFFMAWKDAGEFDIVSGFDKPYQEILFSKITATTATKSYSLENGYWGSEYSYIPELFATTSKRLVTFKNGVIWEHDKNNTKMLFYNSQSYFSIEMSFNDSVDMKDWLSLEILARFSDESLGTFLVDKIEGYTADMQKQQSTLETTDFTKVAGVFRAAYLRDLNTPSVSNPLFTGDVLKSKWLKVRIRTNNTKSFELLMINSYYNISERTNK